jgi:putative membrane protein
VQAATVCCAAQERTTQERKIMRLLIRWLITALALIVAANIVPGIEIRDQNGWVAVLLMAIALGLVNALLRPLLTLLSCPAIMLTLGLFVFVINALCLWAASWVAVNWFGSGFYVTGFFPALWGSIIVSIVSTVLSLLLADNSGRQMARA